MKHAILAVIALIVIAWLGSLVGLDYLFGVVFPYLAFAVFLGGFIYRVVGWAKSPVPFRIPTTSGQGKSLDWVKQDKLDCPATFWQVVGRMLLEVFAFRSLFKNTKAEIHDGPKLVYGSSKWLWLFGLAFHYCFLLIVLRHLRLFLNPVPGFIGTLEFFDGLFQVGVPVLYQTDLIFVGAVTFLFLRRVLIPQVRYISFAADYFPLFLIFAIAATGILMRYILTAYHGVGHRLSIHFRRHRINLLYPCISGQRSVGILSIQQADAPGRCFLKPHQEFSQ
jgi:nitrate reductase gamma subunit